MQIIEFLGMPRAGKTTQICLLREFLEDKGYKVGVIEDRGRGHSVATPPHESLAYVTVLSAIALDEYFLHKNMDFLLVDRGFNDVAAWAELYSTLGAITKKEQEALVTIYERFAMHVSLTLNFEVDPGISIARHQTSRKHQIVDEIGMQESLLAELSKAYKRVTPKMNNCVNINGHRSVDEIHNQIKGLIACE